MDLSAEQKINMSLEDLIAAKNQSTKQKRESKQPANNGEKKKSGGLVISKPRNLAGRANNNTPTRRSNRIRPNTANSNNSNATTSVNSAKVAKSVGTSRANRNAAVNQRRGLNNTGKATKADVNKEVNKQLNQRTGGGLKITFKPGELQKTTDRTVSQQIRAVLSRQAAARAGKANNTNNANGSNSTGRSIASRTSSNSGNTRRSNPKVRGKNTILKVNH